MVEKTDVLVVGAGPTGLFLACLLAELGCSTRIVDRLASPLRTSKAAGIMPRTLEIFDCAGIAERFVAAGNKIGDFSIHGPHGTLLSLSFDRLDTAYPFLLGLEQYRTEELLTERLGELGVTVERELELVSLEQDEDGVSAKLAGETGEAQTVRCSFLVGCDGAHSTVREKLSLPFEGAEDPAHYLAAYLSIDWSIPPSEMFELSSPDGTISGIPLPEGRWAITAEYDGRQWSGADEETPSLDELRRLFDRRSSIPARLSKPLWMRYFRISHRQVPRYQTGRIFLAGDAAHVHSPVGGQGMNTGLQDAGNLAWKLAAVVRREARPELLASYHAERYPVGRSVLRLTSFLQSELDTRSRIAMALRDEATQLVGHSPHIKNLASRLLGELSYHYRRSPVVAEWAAGVRSESRRARREEFAECPDFQAGPHAGDRAPNGALFLAHEGSAPCHMELHDILDCSRHSLLLFEGTHGLEAEPDSVGRLLAVAERVSAAYYGRVQPIVIRTHGSEEALADVGSDQQAIRLLVDDEAVLHHRYGARCECLYLIRPDGYIGYRSRPADIDQLFGYLNSTGVATGGREYRSEAHREATMSAGRTA